MSHFSHFSGTLLLMLSLILILNCRSMELTLVQIMPFHMIQATGRGQAWEGPGGSSKKLQQSQKGTWVPLLTEKMGGRNFGNTRSLKKEWKMENEGKKTDPKSTRPCPETITTEFWGFHLPLNAHKLCFILKLVVFMLSQPLSKFFLNLNCKRRILFYMYF